MNGRATAFQRVQTEHTIFVTIPLSPIIASLLVFFVGTKCPFEVSEPLKINILSFWFPQKELKWLLVQSTLCDGPIDILRVTCTYETGLGARDESVDSCPPSILH